VLLLAAPRVEPLSLCILVALAPTGLLSLKRSHCSLGFSRTGLNSHVNPGLGFVTVGTEESEIGFSILPAVDERDGMIDLPAETNSKTAIRAALICACDHSLFDTRRDWGVICLAYPFLDGSSHGLSLVIDRARWQCEPCPVAP
jgi:hypothetical protein